MYGHWNTTQLPTATQKRSIELAEKELQQVMEMFGKFAADLSSFETALVKAGAPYTPGRKIE